MIHRKDRRGLFTYNPIYSLQIMYDTKVEPTTSKAIKLNLNGIKKISKKEF